MKVITKPSAAPGFLLEDRPVPAIGPDDALIKVRAMGVCGTDVHIYDWDPWAQGRIRPPLIVGHEFVGEVAEVGGNVGFVSAGTRVSGEGHLVCGHCEFCRTGQAHICESVKIIGVDRDGCFAEYLPMPAENLWPVPDEIPDKFAAVFDPLGNAMHTLMAAPISGKSLLITGAGPIGLFAAAMARTAGAIQVIVVEPTELRRQIAAKLDVDLILDPTTDDVEAQVMQATRGSGPEVLLEMSGHPDAMNQGFRLLRPGGQAALLGIPREPVAVDWAKDIIFKGITIHAINGRRMYDTWYQCQGFLLRNPAAIAPVITHVLRFEDYEQAFELIHQGQAGKVVMTFDGNA